MATYNKSLTETKFALTSVLAENSFRGTNFFDTIAGPPAPATPTITFSSSGGSGYTITEYTHISQPNITWGFTGGGYIAYGVAAINGTSTSATAYGGELSFIGGASYTITWNPVPNATGYVIYVTDAGNWAATQSAPQDYPTPYQQATPSLWGYVTTLPSTTTTYSMNGVGNGSNLAPTVATSVLADYFAIAGKKSALFVENPYSLGDTINFKTKVPVTETFTLVETEASKLFHGKLLTETISIRDNGINKPATKNFLEPYTLNETFAPRGSHRLSLSDVVTLNDTEINTQYHFKNFNEVFTITDSAVKVHGTYVTFNDILLLHDTAAHMPRPQFNDGFQVFEDFRPANLRHGLTFLESFVVTDSAFRNVERVTAFFDVFVLGSTESISKGNAKFLSDSDNIFDYYGDYVAYHQPLTETGAGDFPIFDYLFLANPHRTLTFHDAFTYTDSFTHSQFHTIAFYDLTQVFENFDPDLRQAVNVTDVFTVVEVDHSKLLTARFDNVIVLDTFFETRQRMLNLNFGEEFTLIELLSHTYTPAPTPFMSTGTQVHIQLYNRAGFAEVRFNITDNPNFDDDIDVIDPSDKSLALGDVLTIQEKLSLNGTAPVYPVSITDVIAVRDSITFATNHVYTKVVTDEITIRETYIKQISQHISTPVALTERLTFAANRKVTDTVSLVETLKRSHGMKMAFNDSTPIVERGISHA